MAIRNSDTKIRMAPEDWRCVLNELPAGNKITKEMENPKELEMSEDALTQLRSAIIKA